MKTIAFCALALVACSGGGSSNSSNTAATDPTAATDLVINEMNGTGDEWLELYNNGPVAIDLDGIAIADSDKDTGLPKTDQAMRFPKGTSIAKGGYVLVVLDKKNSTPGPYPATQCLKGIDVGCFFALFSISVQRGETVYLLASDNTVMSSTAYPNTLDAGSSDSVCRSPDGTGAWITCTATPGAPNKP